MTGDMVRATLAGTKSETRRLDKLQKVNGNPNLWRFTHMDGVEACFERKTWGLGVRCRCPYGIPGDRLYVRETFALHDHREPPIVYYRADDETRHESDGAWKPSIHMPEWAARIWLEIATVRVERVQEITGESAKAEGIEVAATSIKGSTLPHRYHFIQLWNRLNATRGYAWKRNPWVWVIQFRKL